MLAKVFKAYDVRATYPKPLNEKLAWQIGYGTAELLRGEARAAGCWAVGVALTGNIAGLMAEELAALDDDFASSSFFSSSYCAYAWARALSNTSSQSWMSGPQALARSIQDPSAPVFCNWSYEIMAR